MSYVVESASARRARRRRRTAITLLVVVALLAGAFYYAASYMRGSTKATATPTTTCTTTTKPAAGKSTKPALKPSQITLNVYNATNRAGLAKSTADSLKSRGFVIGRTDNDPLGKTITQAAEIRYGRNGAAAAAVVVKLVAGAKAVLDARADASVDLVLGNAFTALAAASSGASTPC